MFILTKNSFIAKNFHFLKEYINRMVRIQKGGQIKHLVCLVSWMISSEHELRGTILSASD